MDKNARPPTDSDDLSTALLADDRGESIKEQPESTEVMKNPAAVELGRLGGKIGGKKRAEKLTPEQRFEIAQKAAKARWRKNGQ